MNIQTDKRSSETAEAVKAFAYLVLALLLIGVLMLLDDAMSCSSRWKYTKFPHRFEWNGGVCMVKRDGVWVPGYVVQYEIATGKLEAYPRMERIK